MRDAEGTRGVKVIDRRSFTADGEPRDTRPDAATSPGSPSPTEVGSEALATEPVEPDTAPVAQPHGRVRFVDLVDALTQPALALLAGRVPGRGRDVEAARDYVDLLEILRHKTQGHLTPEESRHLEDVLHQLRALTVATAR